MTAAAMAMGGNAAESRSSEDGAGRGEKVVGSEVVDGRRSRRMGGMPAPRQRKGSGQRRDVLMVAWGALDCCICVSSVLLSSLLFCSALSM